MGNTSGPIPTFASMSQQALFANVGIKGPLANMTFSGVLDLAFALRIRGQGVANAQIHSTSASH
jgi:hypothetical protein